MCGMLIIIGIPLLLGVLGFISFGPLGAVLGVIIGIWFVAKLNGR